MIITLNNGRNIYIIAYYITLYKALYNMVVHHNKFGIPHPTVRIPSGTYCVKFRIRISLLRLNQLIKVFSPKSLVFS